MVCLLFLSAWLQGPRVNGAAGRRTVDGATVWVCVCARVRVHRGVPRGQRGIRVTARRGAASEALRGFTRLAAGISKK